MTNNILSIKHVNFAYHSLFGETPVLKDINLSVREGEFVAIVGPSGCGKSTLLSLIAHLIEPEEGSVDYYGNRIGYMLQKDHLLEWLSIYNNVTLGLKMHHIKDPAYFAAVDTLLRQYELMDFSHKKPSELSGGMRQRAALIRTLALNPELILLDEPFSALDYQTRLSVSADICNRIKESHKTAILITHDLEEAIRLSERILVLSKRPARICLNITVPDFKESLQEDLSKDLQNDLSQNLQQDSKKIHENYNITKDPRYHEIFKKLWEALQYEN